MCGTCGCGNDDNILFRKPGEKPVFNHQHKYRHTHIHTHDGVEHEHDHEHHYHHTHDGYGAHDHEMHDHPGEHVHSHDGHEGVVKSQREVAVQTDVLSFNKLRAERNRGYFEALKITAYNMVSSPGSGKTSVLERTIQLLKDKISFFVIEGDQQTMLDAQRIDALGIPVVQVNTGSGCHLDAAMVAKSFEKLELTTGSTLFIENVGNLVCPSMFDLGEACRVAIISTTEGDDKPLKYPDIFASSDVCIINKIDLLPYLDCNLEVLKQNALKVNPRLIFFELSAKTSQGFEAWLEWIRLNQRT